MEFKQLIAGLVAAGELASHGPAGESGERLTGFMGDDAPVAALLLPADDAD